MNILPARSLPAAGALALAIACGGGRPAVPLDVRQRFETTGLPSVDVRLSIQPEHDRARQRYVRAATATLKNHGEWLGPFPQPALTIVDPPRLGPPAAQDGDAVVLEPTPWWSTSTSMAPELATARAVSRRFWTTLLDTRALPPWFVDGLVEYGARRVAPGLFEQENLPPGYADVEERYFGRLVPLRVRIRLLPETDGDPLPAYQANPTADVRASPPAPADVRALRAKTMLTLGTLERWVGRPVFDQIIAAFVREFRSGRPSVADLARTATAVSGQDLSWLFDEAFGSSRELDYGVGRVTSAPGADRSFETTVTVRRFGDALFTGTSAAPVGAFESGRGITLRVTFEDGQQRTDYWDGRGREKAFTYRSPARAVAAFVDPDRTLLLDVKQTNNSWTLVPQAGVAATRWAARWLWWLENALLNYAALV